MTLRIDRRLALGMGLAALVQFPLRAAEPTVDPPASQVLDQRLRGAKSKTDKAPVTSSVAMAPGGQMFATGGDDHQVRLWNRADGKLIAALSGHEDWVRSVAFSPDGSRLASAGDDHQIIFWDLAGRKPARILPRHEHVIYQVIFSPDSSLLAAVGFEERVSLYHAESGEPSLQLAGPCADVRAVAFSPDGGRLAAAGRNGRIRVWSVQDGQTLLDFSAGAERVRSLAYSPSGDAIVSAGDGRYLSAWDARNGQNVCRIESPKGKAFAIKFCGPTLLASGGSDNVIHLWDLAARAEQFHLRGHTGTITSLDYDTASGALVSGSFDTTIRVWPLKPQVAEPAQEAARDPRRR